MNIDILELLSEDMIYEISTRIPRGAWKSFIFTCRAFYAYNSPAEIAARANHLKTLVYMYPNHPWDWYNMSKNPNLDHEMYAKNMDKQWSRYNLLGNSSFKVDIGCLSGKKDISIMSRNKGIEWDTVQDHINEDWNWFDLSRVININFKILIHQRVLTKKLNWKGLSYNEHINGKIVEFFDDKPWDWDGLSINDKITFNTVIKLKRKPWNWQLLSQNPGITNEIIKDNLDMNWDWHELSRNKNISIEIILNNINQSWDWRLLSRNSNITFADVFKHPQLKWDWSSLSQNPNITISIVLDNLDKPWDWTMLSYNIHTPFDLVEKLDNVEWDWTGLSNNKHITYDILTKYSNKPWDKDILSSNTHIDLSMVKLFPREFWNWHELSRNRSLTFTVVQENINIYNGWKFGILSTNIFNYNQ